MIALGPAEEFNKEKKEGEDGKEQKNNHIVF